MTHLNAEPSVGQARDEILQHIDLDGRVRRIEVQQATTATELSGLKDEVRSMKTDIVAEIRASKPPSPWPAVSALAAVLAVVLVVAARLYGA